MTDIIIGQLYIFFILSFYSITTITKPSIVNFIQEILDLLLLIYSNSSHFCMELVLIHISLDELLIVALGSIERYLLQFFIIYSYLVIVLFFDKFHYFYVFYFQLVFMLLVFTMVIAVYYWFEFIFNEWKWKDKENFGKKIFEWLLNYYSLFNYMDTIKSSFFL